MNATDQLASFARLPLKIARVFWPQKPQDSALLSTSIRYLHSPRFSLRAHVLVLSCPMNPAPSNDLSASASGEESLSIPDSKILSQARELALERLHAERVSELAARSAARPVSRRDAIAALGAGAVTAAAWTSLLYSVSADARLKQGAEPGEHRLFRLEDGWRLAWETVLFQGGQFALGTVCRRLQLPIGNSGFKVREVPKSSVVKAVELFEKDPFLAYRIYSAVALTGPFAEESIFRIVPNMFLSREGTQWQVGVPSALLFAAIHNLSTHGPAGSSVEVAPGVRLSLDMVPLPQFLLGAFCWHLMRRYGDLAPYVAHVFNNQATAIGVVWGGRVTMQDFQRLVAEELEVIEAGQKRGDAPGESR